MDDNSLRKLLNEIEPKVQDIENNRLELKALKEVFKTIEELIDVSKNSYNEIFRFYDQEFIYKCIKIGKSNYNDWIDKYHVAKYLLENNSSKLKDLPQYQESVVYMDSLYKYLYGLYESIELDFESKKQNLEIQELLNKYYRILSKESIFVPDVYEFISFIELNNLDIKDTLNIYRQICKDNIKYYTKSVEMKLDDDITLADVEELLKNNKNLLNDEYIESDNNVKLDDYLNNNEEYDEIYFENRKKYLIHIIKQYYDDKQYMEIVELYKEFIKISEMQEEFKKQRIMPKKLLFVFENDKSLFRSFLDKVELKYKNCILKNLLDIENDNTLSIPVKKYEKVYLYVKDEFKVKTVYTYLDNGKILILGVLDKDELLNDYLLRHKSLFKETFDNINTINQINDERDLLLKNIKLEDLVLNIDLETLDVKVEGKNAK